MKYPGIGQVEPAAAEQQASIDCVQAYISRRERETFRRDSLAVALATGGLLAFAWGASAAAEYHHRKVDELEAFVQQHTVIQSIGNSKYTCRPTDLDLKKYSCVSHPR